MLSPALSYLSALIHDVFGNLQSPVQNWCLRNCFSDERLKGWLLFLLLSELTGSFLLIHQSLAHTSSYLCVSTVRSVYSPFIYFLELPRQVWTLSSLSAPAHSTPPIITLIAAVAVSGPLTCSVLNGKDCVWGSSISPALTPRGRSLSICGIQEKELFIFLRVSHEVVCWKWLVVAHEGHLLILILRTFMNQLLSTGIWKVKL